MRVDGIKPKHIDEWILHLKKKTYKNERYSFINEYRLLRAILNWYIKNDDYANLILPFKGRHREMLIYKKKDKMKLRNHLSVRETNRFLKELKKVAPHFFEIALIQILQVKRISEVAGMEWEFFDRGQKTYNFCKMVEFIQVKGKDQALLRFGKKNMEAGEYDLQPLRKQVYEALEKLRKKRDKKCPYIFHNEGKLWHYKEIQNKYNLAFRRAKLPFSGTHVLRHTGATMFLTQTNGNFMALKSFGGWEDMNQVLHYGKVTQIHLKKAIKMADKFVLR